MFSIGEFSKASGLSVKTLRFYHERGLLVPVHVDQQSGYRYYDTQNLEKAGVIKVLREFEFALDDIQIILAECGEDQDALEYLQNHKQTLLKKLHHYQNLVQKLDQVISYKQEDREMAEMQKMSFEIKECKVEPVLVAGIKMQGKYSDCSTAFRKLGKQIGRYISGKAMILCYDDEYRENDANFEPCFPIRKEIKSDGLSVHTLPAVNCVSLIHQGPYDTISQAYGRLIEHIKEKRFEIQLPSREIYLKGPGMIFKGNPKKYLTEVQLPIA